MIVWKTVSKLICLDRLSVNQIVNCEFIRDSLKDRGMILPKHRTTVMNLIYNEYEAMKSKIIFDINKLITQGTCLSDRAFDAFCFIRYYSQNND